MSCRVDVHASKFIPFEMPNVTLARLKLVMIFRLLLMGPIVMNSITEIMLNIDKYCIFNLLLDLKVKVNEKQM